MLVLLQMTYQHITNRNTPIVITEYGEVLFGIRTINMVKINRQAIGNLHLESPAQLNIPQAQLYSNDLDKNQP